MGMTHRFEMRGCILLKIHLLIMSEAITWMTVQLETEPPVEPRYDITNIEIEDLVRVDALMEPDYDIIIEPIATTKQFYRRVITYEKIALKTSALSGENVTVTP